MKKILIILFILCFSFNVYAGTITRHTTYATNSQVTSTNLNGNLDNIVNVCNGGLDNTNADTGSGFRFLEVLGALPAAGTQGRTVFLTTNNTFNFDTGSAWQQTFGITGTPAQGDILYYNGSAWVLLVAGTSGNFLKTQGASANPVWANIGYAQSAWATFDGTAGTITAADSYNLSSITDVSAGKYTMNWSITFGNTNYVVLCNSQRDTTDANSSFTAAIRNISNALTTTTTNIETVNDAHVDANNDSVYLVVVAFGD